MEFTGERYIPNEQGRIRLEHYHRYILAFEIVDKKDVLDIACGEGYGSFLISKKANSVVGVDISDEAISHAANEYSSANLSFKKGNAISLDFESESFDVVVSYETIEHLLEQEKMVNELKRVLRPGGILIISSPNRPIYTEESGEVNHYHVKELDYNEFDDLLKKQFSNINYYGQRIIMGSVIQPIQGKNQGFYQAWHDDGLSINKNSGNMLDPVYFVAVCKDGLQELPQFDMSLLVPEKLDLVKHYVGFAKWAKNLDKVIAQRDIEVEALNQIIYEKDEQINSKISMHVGSPEILDAQMGKNSEKIYDLIYNLERKIENERAHIIKINQSFSWKITLPLREVSRWCKNPKEQIDKYKKVFRKIILK